MNQAISMQFRTPPGTLSQYLRALFARGKGQAEPEFPAIDALLRGVRPDPAKVQAYARVCGFNPQNNWLPLTYPHILAFPLHMELMLHKDFPLPLMGLVHVRNSIQQRRRIRPDETLDIRARLSSGRQTDKGTEFDIVTEVSSGGVIIWTSISTNLYRRKSSAGTAARKVPSVPESFTNSENWALPGSLGRQYARVSGDSNPIHLHPFAARLFGFKRHIAHGMWSKARIAAALESKAGEGTVSLTTDFRLPVFLPAQVEFCYSRDDGNGEVRFELRSPGGDKVHVRGTLAR